MLLYRLVFAWSIVMRKMGFIDRQIVNDLQAKIVNDLIRASIYFILFVVLTLWCVFLYRDEIEMYAKGKCYLTRNGY